MKKILLYGFVLTMLLPVGAAEAAPVALTTHETIIAAKDTAIFKRKRKGFHRKKGFMWGLFKKNDCGCPKH